MQAAWQQGHWRQSWGWGPPAASPACASGPHPTLVRNKATCYLKQLHYEPINGGLAEATSANAPLRFRVFRLLASLGLPVPPRTQARMEVLGNEIRCLAALFWHPSRLHPTLSAASEITRWLGGTLLVQKAFGATLGSTFKLQASSSSSLPPWAVTSALQQNSRNHTAKTHVCLALDKLPASTPLFFRSRGLSLQGGLQHGPKLLGFSDRALGMADASVSEECCVWIGRMWKTCGQVP